MMRSARIFLRDQNAAAAAELALVTPILMALMFGSLELGNFFNDEHALQKQVMDGARYASRLELATAYSCPNTVFQDTDYSTKVINVTQNGVVSGSGNPRWTDYWTRTCAGKTQTLTVTLRCVAKNQIDTTATGNTGIYTSLSGTNIPIVKVSGEVRYRSVLASLGFNTVNLCLKAESEAAVQGL